MANTTSAVRVQVRGSGGLQLPAGVAVEVDIDRPDGAQAVRDAVLASMVMMGGSEGGEQQQQQQVASQLDPRAKYRVLIGGKFLHDDAPVRQQVRALANSSSSSSSSSIRVLLMPPRLGDEGTESKAEQVERDEISAKMAATRVDRLTRAALRIARREEAQQLQGGGAGGGDERYEFELQDQDGKPVDLPAHEIVALKTGMVLFEKGSAFLRRGEFAAARELLSESDVSFSRCSGELLETVDNFAVLQLNLCWTFLQLRDPAFLPEAKRRLERAEGILERAHGQSMERLLAVKGATGPTLVLYLRLQLLKGVVQFYEQRHVAAMQTLDTAAGLLAELEVDAASMTAIMGMGFTEREARLGLRAAKTVEPAVLHIMSRREKIAEMRRAERERARQRRLGATADGSPIDLHAVKNLVGMGFRKSMSVAALRQTNNDVAMAQLILTETPELLAPALARSSEQREQQQAEVDDASVATVMGMGFEREMALGTLRATQGNVERAVELLLSGQGVKAEEPSSNGAELDGGQGAEVGEAAPPAEASGGDATMDAAAAAEAAEAARIAAEREEEERRDEEELIEELDLDEEAYLDSPLTEEAAVLAEFREAVRSASQR